MHCVEYGSEKFKNFYVTFQNIEKGLRQIHSYFTMLCWKRTMVKQSCLSLDPGLCHAVVGISRLFPALVSLFYKMRAIRVPRSEGEWELNQLKYVKCLEQTVAHSKCYRRTIITSTGGKYVHRGVVHFKRASATIRKKTLETTKGILQKPRFRNHGKYLIEKGVKENIHLPNQRGKDLS